MGAVGWWCSGAVLRVLGFAALVANGAQAAEAEKAPPADQGRSGDPSDTSRSVEFSAGTFSALGPLSAVSVGLLGGVRFDVARRVSLSARGGASVSEFGNLGATSLNYVLSEALACVKVTRDNPRLDLCGGIGLENIEETRFSRSENHLYGTGLVGFNLTHWFGPHVGAGLDLEMVFPTASGTVGLGPAEPPGSAGDSRPVIGTISAGLRSALRLAYRL